MFRFLPYTLKTLWRHRVRTMLTVSGSAVALFVFGMIGALERGLDDLGRRQADQRSLVVFQANKFCPATSHLPEDYAQTIARIPGVRDVMPVQVFTNNCRASLDVIVFYGVPPGKLRALRDFELLEGDWSEFEGRRDAALVGRAVAERRGLKLGDRFTIGELTTHIAGIFRSSDPAEENYIYSHLEFLQRGRGLDLVGTVTQLEVQLEPSVSTAETCELIDERFRNGPVETDTRPKGVFQARSLGDLFQMVGMTRVLGFACVGLVLVLVATTTLMSVQDRQQEHAVLQTLGCTGARVFGLVMLESVVLSLSGGLVGVGAVLLLLSQASLSISAEAVTIALTPSFGLAGQGLLVSVVAGFVAGIPSGWQAGRIEIVPALRHR